jgi:hypothetical protein
MIDIVQGMTTLLKSPSSSAVTFATADNSIAATGIGTAFPAGKKINIAGATNSGNNSTFTVMSATANKVIVSETVTAESPGAAVVINEEYQSAWKDVSDRTDIVGAANASQACIVFVDFSNDGGDNTDYTEIIGVDAGVPQSINLPVITHHCRLRVRNGGTAQTSLRVFLNGKRGG